MFRNSLILSAILLAGCDRVHEDAKAKPKPDEPKPTESGPKVSPKPEPKKPPRDTRRKNGAQIEGWGIVSDPDGDCTIREENGMVSIEIPGTLHDINPTKDRRNAPKILRPVEGDFKVVVRVTGDFTPIGPSTSKSSVPFNGAGLLLYSDETNLLWFARNKFIAGPNAEGLCFAPLFELFHDGRNANVNPRSTSSQAFKGESTALYLAREGDKLIGRYSHDAKTWEQSLEATTRLPRKLQIGVAVVSTSAQPFKVTLDGFKLLDE